jgi:hypothetical protein
VLGSVSEVRTAERRAWEHAQLRKVALAGLALVALGGVLALFGSAGARMLRGLIA